MAKKPMNREELLAQLNALDTATETAKLEAEVSRLTEEVASLTSQRNDFEKQVRQLEKNMETIRQAVNGIDRRSRTHGSQGLREASAIASRLSMTHVRIGIQSGTHDPATGLEYTADTKPVRDLSAGTPKVTSGELERIFPALAGPVNYISEGDADPAYSVDASLFDTPISAVEIAGT